MKAIKLKHSLNRQITVIFVAIMFLTIGMCWLICNLFLEKYYVHNKEKTLLNAYESIEHACNKDILFKDEYKLELQKYCGINNVNAVILGNGYLPTLVYATEPQDFLVNELRANMKGQIRDKEMIVEADNYVLFRARDERMDTDCLEMWGVLSNGCTFLLKSTIESIKISAGIATRFLLFVGLGMAVISGFFIFFFTRRISKPILELSDIATRMSNMDFEARYEGKEKTEIAVLGNSMNSMSVSLQDTISKLQTANTKLQQDVEEKEKINRLQKDFISNVSHELKTPIALVQGYAEGLKEEVSDEESRDYYCDVIIDEAGKMNSMVKKLLTLNQLESGNDVLNIERFDLATMVSNYAASAEILTKSQNIRVKVILPNEVPVNVWADEFKIEEVLMNFFTNACNHCESESEKRIDVIVEKYENVAKVTVFNTGKSIPEEALPVIWDKFYKVDKARTREYGGSGVGLSIVKAIMEAHHQQYGVYNTQGGVCFWFTVDASE